MCSDLEPNQYEGHSKYFNIQFLKDRRLFPVCLYVRGKEIEFKMLCLLKKFEAIGQVFFELYCPLFKRGSLRLPLSQCCLVYSPAVKKKMTQKW